MRAFDLSGYDAVLAFGETLAAVYRGWGWDGRVFVWHEAADTTLFQPPTGPSARDGAVWVGNWGDGERTAELQEFLFAPLARADVKLDVYARPLPGRGVAGRWRDTAPATMAGSRTTTCPPVFARHQFTVHVPRRFYVTHLPGIPTIRVFEALACGIPLISAPWSDSESLFTPGEDFLVARDGAAAEDHVRTLLHDPDRAAALAAHGLATIRARHTCAHRAAELLAIVRQAA